MMNTTSLIILDGWGNGKGYPGNAVKLANTPTWDELVKQCPLRELIACGELVGLPDGQMGNSEVGHTILGAGRIVYQTLMRINKALEDNSLASNTQLDNFLREIKAKQKQSQDVTNARPPHLHLMGLLSDGGVHSHQEHFAAILRIAVDKGIEHIKLHLFLDGRDTSPKSAPDFVDFIQQTIDSIGTSQTVQIASACGRYYAMDRDKRWERTKNTYDTLVSDPTATVILDKPIPLVDDINKQIKSCYEQDLTDEFMPPFVSKDAASGLTAGKGFIEENDYIISINFRADRVRQITSALAAEEFDAFERPFIMPRSHLISMTDYDPSLPLPYIFGKEKINNALGEVISAMGMKQLRLAETEKFAHVTYFFNGGREEPFTNEIRTLIPSLKVATYDLAPQMCAPEITDKLVEAINSGEYGFILCNYANGDMVGHSGKIDAAIKTVEVLDESLQRVIEALDASDGQALITADHGNCEELLIGDPPKPQTAHTLNPVPLLYYGGRGRAKKVKFDQEVGGLADIAPSILKLMGIDIPKEMTGRVLVSFNE